MKRGPQKFCGPLFFLGSWLWGGAPLPAVCHGWHPAQVLVGLSERPITNGRAMLRRAISSTKATPPAYSKPARASRSSREFPYGAHFRDRTDSPGRLRARAHRYAYRRVRIRSCADACRCRRVLLDQGLGCAVPWRANHRGRNDSRHGERQARGCRMAGAAVARDGLDLALRSIFERHGFCTGCPTALSGRTATMVWEKCV